MHKVYLFAVMAGVLLAVVGWVQPVEARRADISQALKQAERGKWEKALEFAREADDPLIYKYVRWVYLTEKGSGATFRDITRFATENPDWPRQMALRLRAEEAIQTESVSIDELQRWFAAYPPVTARGKWRYVDALRREGGKYESGRILSDKQTTDWIREIWRGGDWGSVEEQNFLRDYGDRLTIEDHNARIDNLLWMGHTSAAKEDIKLADAAHRKLFEARIAVQTNESGLDKKIDQVPESLRHDAGLLFDRIQWRNKRGKDEGVRELLLQAPSSLPHPEKWWPIQKAQIVKLMDEERYEQAYKLASKHYQQDGLERVEAEWIAGRLALFFLNHPSDAYRHFYALYQNSRYPISRSRGAYWAGIASRRYGHEDIALRWFAKAWEFPTAFYGLLAGLELGKKSVVFPSPARSAHAARAEFGKQELPRLIVTLTKAKEFWRAKELLLHLVDHGRNQAERVLAIEWAQHHTRKDIALQSAKRAWQEYGILVADVNYPLLAVTGKAEVETALVLSIARQESEFRPDAQSAAGAVGLMQVLPTTARHVASRNGIRYSSHRLKNSEHYNMEIGALYLQRLIARYDGALVLAIASYNAGPGRVTSWIKELGDPREEGVDVVEWIESIPYYETRNYVQRVLENLQVYRARLDRKKGSNLRLISDLGME